MSLFGMFGPNLSDDQEESINHIKEELGLDSLLGERVSNGFILECAVELGLRCYLDDWREIIIEKYEKIVSEDRERLEEKEEKFKTFREETDN